MAKRLDARLTALERDRPETEGRLIVVAQNAEGNVDRADQARLDGARDYDHVVIISKRPKT